MKASLEIRKATDGWNIGIFWVKNKSGETVESADDIRAMGEQHTAIVLGWADPVEVEWKRKSQGYWK